MPTLYSTLLASQTPAIRWSRGIVAFCGNNGMLAIVVIASALLLFGCSSNTFKDAADAKRPDKQVKIISLIPADIPDRKGWAADITAAFNAQQIQFTASNICSVLSVTAQESTFQVDPPVPGLAKIAWDEIENRAAKVHIPAFVVRTALLIKSPSGKSYSERLDKARTEKELSAIFDDFIDMVPMGQTLFGKLNPVRTGGPMQVSIAFAESHSQSYPYPVANSIRQEVFSRRGGMYFGIAHLLGYPANYGAPLYRFADFNAGWYASRNAAFQHAVSELSAIPLALDGDLVNYGSDKPGATELAVRALASRLDMGPSAIRRALDKGETLDFEETGLYKRVFALADKADGKPSPRAVLPGIRLESPKITRKLTTAWFANRVDDRYRRCMARAAR